MSDMKNHFLFVLFYLRSTSLFVLPTTPRLFQHHHCFAYHAETMITPTSFGNVESLNHIISSMEDVIFERRLRHTLWIPGYFAKFRSAYLPIGRLWNISRISRNSIMSEDALSLIGILIIETSIHQHAYHFARMLKSAQMRTILSLNSNRSVQKTLQCQQKIHTFRSFSEQNILREKG